MYCLTCPHQRNSARSVCVCVCVCVCVYVCVRVCVYCVCHREMAPLTALTPAVQSHNTLDSAPATRPSTVCAHVHTPSLQLYVYRIHASHGQACTYVINVHIYASYTYIYTSTGYEQATDRPAHTSINTSKSMSFPRMQPALI